jgi:hypothetical protein
MGWLIDCDERHSGVGRPHVIFVRVLLKPRTDRSMSYEQSRRDHLTSTTKNGKIELTEEQLRRVVGGGEWTSKCDRIPMRGAVIEYSSLKVRAY